MLDASTMHGVRRPPRRPVWDQLGDGIRYAKRTPALAFTLVLLSVIGTFGYNFGVSLPLLATQALQLGAVGFGSLNTAMGVGSLFGALGLAARLDPTRRALLLSAASFSLVLLIVAFLPWYPMTLVALVVLGIFSVTYSAVTNTILQLNSDEEYRGRVLSLYTLLFAGSTPIGGAITGALADAMGIRDALVAEGAVCLLAVAAGVLWSTRRRAPQVRAEARTAGESG
jgi:MFS family permease